jgi:site-specific DNA recombinase
MGKLDSLVIEGVKAQLFEPDRMSTILGALLDRQATKDTAVEERRCVLKSEIKAKDEKLNRLYRAIEDGIVETDAQLRDRIKALKNERDLAQTSLDRIVEQSKNRSTLTPERIQAFTKLMHDKLENGDVQARKAYLRAVISEIRVDDDKVSIIGDKATLSAVIAGQNGSHPNVSGFVRKWRARNDSNVRPSDS